MTKNEDESLAQIRRVRHEISEEFGHDPNRLVDHYIALQNSHADRLLEKDPPKEESGMQPHNIALEPSARN